jgi:hypothetical protein
VRPDAAFATERLLGQRLRLEPASAAVPAATDDEQHDDDDQKSGGIHVQPPGPPLMSGRLGMPSFDGSSQFVGQIIIRRNHDLFKIAHIAEIVGRTPGRVAFIRCRLENRGRRDRKQ